MTFSGYEKIVRIKSPSKIIITGEHLFFYSNRAILKTINNYLYLEGGAGKEILTKEEGYIFCALDKFKIEKTFSFDFIQTGYRKIIDKYLQYLATGENFNTILQEDYDLFLAIAGFFIANYKDSIKNNLHLRIFNKKNYITSKGLGSSASFILLIIRAFDELLSLNLTQKEIFEIAVMFENLKHGKTSGIDVLCIAENSNSFISVEKNTENGSLWISKNLRSLYFEFKATTKDGSDYNFYLNDFKVQKLKNHLIKTVHLYNNFDPKNIFNTQDVIRHILPKKAFMKQNSSLFVEIYNNIKTAINNKNLKSEKRKILFTEAIKLNNRILFELGLIPDDDMRIIEEKEINEKFVGKITGSGGFKDLPKSAGCLIFFEVK